MILIKQLIEEGLAEWQSSTQYDSFTKWYVSDQQRDEYENKLAAFIIKLNRFMEQLPNQNASRKLWKQKALTEITKMMQSGDSHFFSGLNETERTLFQDMTISFLRDVRSFDSELSLQDTMQALRNIWILAILQCLFHKYSGYHKAMFAYSMLYPYSDNYLDDPDVSKAHKMQFNEWFTKRLKGAITPKNAHEKRISSLIALIEEQFDRKEYPQVYEALLLIQSAQIRSLQQQDGAVSLGDDKLLEISYEKGGTSVIADGILIDGFLDEEQQRFCMRFGFMLQLGDDIQDAISDHINAHQTLLSNHSMQNADTLIRKLLAYIQSSLRGSKVCDRSELLQFVEKDCFYLIFYALFQKHAIMVSQALRQTIQYCLPLSAAFLTDLTRQYENRYSEDRLWECVDTLIENDGF